MKVSRVLLYLGLGILCSCKSDHEKLIGHWHIYDVHDSIGNHSSYAAIDISDSSINIYGWSGIYSMYAPAEAFIDDTIHYMIHDYYMTRYSLHHDTLRLRGGLWENGIGVRSFDCTYIEDRFSELHVDIDLPEASYYSDLEYSIFNSHIAVGVLKRNFSEGQTSKNSSRVQVLDRIINLDGIETFVQNELDKMDEVDRGLARFLLDIDLSTKMSLVDSIRYKIHRAVPNPVYYSVTGTPEKRTQYGFQDLDTSIHLYEKSLNKQPISDLATYFDYVNWNHNLTIEINQGENVTTKQADSFDGFIKSIKNKESRSLQSEGASWKASLQSLKEKGSFSVILIYDDDISLQDYISIASTIRATYSTLLEQKSLSTYDKELSALNNLEKASLFKSYPFQVNELSEFEFTAFDFSQ